MSVGLDFDHVGNVKSKAKTVESSKQTYKRLKKKLNQYNVQRQEMFSYCRNSLSFLISVPLAVIFSFLWLDTIHILYMQILQNTVGSF